MTPEPEKEPTPPAAPIMVQNGNQTVRTIGGLVIAIGCTVAAIILVWRNAPVTAWATAFALGLVGATIIEPATIRQWIFPK